MTCLSGSRQPASKLSSGFVWRLYGSTGTADRKAYVRHSNEVGVPYITPETGDHGHVSAASQPASHLYVGVIT